MDKLIELQATDTAHTAVDRLDPKPESIILLLGSPGKDLSKARDLLSHSLVPAALDANALVIVGESKSDDSLFPLFSEIVKDIDVARTIGMRLPAERGIVSPFEIAAQLGKAPKGAGRPAAAILLGGADRDIPTLLDCTKQEWPIVVISGSGGLADRLLNVKTAARLESDLAQIALSAGIRPFPIEGAFETVRRAVTEMLRPQSVIAILGDFADAARPRIRSILSRAVAPLALDASSLIVDNGANTGIAAAMGAAAGDQDTPPMMLAIAAAGAQDLEPHHTAVFRLPPDTNDFAKATFQKISELAEGPQGEKPVLAMLFGGTDAQLPSLVQCARRQWPILLISAAPNDLADRIAQAIAAANPKQGDPVQNPNPDIAEIVETGNSTAVSIDAPLDPLEKIIGAHLENRINTLADAWARYEDLDIAAVKKRITYRLVQLLILGFGLMATLVAILQPQIISRTPAGVTSPYLRPLHILTIVVPLIISGLVAANNRFRDGTKWILMRSAAEAIKREIFRYRARAGVYSTLQVADTSREARLAARIKDISSDLFQSEVNKTSVQRIVWNNPKRLRFLTPDEYVRERIEDQIRFMVKKTSQLDRENWWLHVCIYIAGGLGSLLAALGVDVWVAMTAAIATALTTKLEADQVENSLVQYNQTLEALKDIRTWWNALSRWEKSRRKNIDLLVEQTEQSMESEMKGWAQQMKSALDKLTEKENAEQQEKTQAAAK